MMRKIIRYLAGILVALQLVAFIPPKPAEALPNPLDAANEIGRQVLDMLPIDTYRDYVENMMRRTNPLVRAGKDALTHTRETAKFLVCEMMHYRKLPDRLIKGNFDAINPPDCPLPEFAAGMPTVQQKEKSDQLVQILSTGDASQAFGLLQLAPVDVNFGFDLPGDAGRVWAKKQGAQIGICVWLHQGDAAALFGVSNEENLCGGKADNLQNQGNVPTAFLDVTLDGYGYIYTSLPLALTSPTFSAVGYAPLVNDKYFKFEIGALKNEMISAEFSLGLAATFDAEVTLEGEASVSLSIEVSTGHASRLVSGITNRMMGALNSLADEVIINNGRVSLKPEDAATVLMDALDFVRLYNAGEPGAIGSVTIGADLTGSLGIGAADTVWPLAAATGALSCQFPVDSLVNLSGVVLQSYLIAATTVGGSFLQMSSAALAGQPGNDIALTAQTALDNAWNNEVKPAIEASLGEMLGDASLETKFTVNLLGTGTPGSPADTQSSIEIYTFGATVPLGTAVSNAFDATFWTDVANGLIALFPRTLKEKMYQDMTPPTYDADAFGDVPDDTIITVTAAPLIPVIQAYADFPVRALMDLLAVGLVGTGDVMDAIVDSAASGSLAPFEAQNIVNTLNQLQKDVRDEVVVGMRTGLGANGSIGVEAEMEIGVGASLYAHTNLEMLLMLASVGALDEPEADGHAVVGFDVSGDLAAGLSLGEGVELSATGGLSTSKTMISLELSEMDGARPRHVLHVPESGDAYLQNLAVGPGLSLKEAFSPTTFYYTAEIPYEYDAPTFDVIATTSDAAAQLTISGTARVSGAPTPTNLNPSGTNLVEIKVTSSDGSQTQTYYIETQRKSNTKLKSLKLAIPVGLGSEYVFPIGADTTFTYQVDEDVNYVGVTAETENPFAAMTINGASTKTMGLFLLPGVNTYSIVVSAVDGTVSGGVKESAYTLQIVRKKSSEAILENLTVGGSNYFSGIQFSHLIMNYMKRVPANVTSIDVIPEAQLMKGSTITVNGNPVTSGSAFRVPLAYGDNQIRIKVTAEDEVQTNEYLVIVTRIPVQKLTRLDVTGGAVLNQPFDPNKTVQKLRIVNSTQPFQFAGTYDPNPNIIDQFIRCYGSADFTGGEWGSLQPKANSTIPLVYWQQIPEGYWNRMPYLLIMPDANASTNANLSGLQLSDPGGAVSLSPAFQKSVTNYTATANWQDLRITPTPEDPRARVFVNGEFNDQGTYDVRLVEGMNEVSILAVAEDGTTKTYKVMVDYRGAAHNADLASLSCNGCATNIQNFNPNTTAYTVDVPNNAGSITISANVAQYDAERQAGASVAIFDFT
ncbi:MAG TPA: cadherin-like beta sandwich domain-containing protein, partial [Bacilli bacterium]